MLKQLRTGVAVVGLMVLCGALCVTRTANAACTITSDTNYPELLPPPSGNIWSVRSQGNWTLNTYNAYDVKVYIRFKKPDGTYEMKVNGESISTTNIGVRQSPENMYIQENYGTFEGSVSTTLEQGKTYEYKLYLRANDSQQSSVATWKTGTTWHELKP